MLSKKLKEFRELCDFSQQQVADCLNIERSTYSYYELGRTEPSIENLKKLARIYGVPVYDLLELDSNTEPAMVHDNGYNAEDARLDERIGVKVGDLTREEKRLVMRFRMLTDSQRKNIMLALCATAAEPEDEKKRMD